MSHHRERMQVLLILFLLLLGGCTRGPAPTTGPSSKTAPTASPTTALPPAPSPTPLPAPSPTPTPAGPLPPPPIGLENLAGLHVSAVAGAGTLGPIALSPDGRTLAVAGSQGIWLIDKYNLRTRHHLTGHAGSVSTVAWSPDGMKLVSGGTDGTVRIWALDDGAPFQDALFVGHSGEVRAVAWSPDGSLIASGGEDRSIQVWDAASYRSLRTFFHTSAVYSLDWHPTSPRLLVGEFDGSISAVDASSGETLASFFSHDGWVNSVRWSPDGIAAASAGLDRTLRIWDVVEESDGALTFNERISIPTLFSVQAVAWSPDGRRIAAGGGTPYEIRIYNPAPPAEGGTNLTPTLTLSGHHGAIQGLAYAPGGVLISTGKDNTLRVWGLNSGEELRRLSPADGTAFSGPLNVAAWSPDGSLIATGGADGTLRVWDPANGGFLFAVQAHKVSLDALAWSPGGKWIATGGSDNVTRLWDAESGDLLQEMRSEGGRINALAFSPFGNQLATGGFLRIVQVWQAGTDQPPLLLYPDVEITALGWASSGTFLAVGGSDGSIQLYNTTAATEIGVLSGAHNTPIRALAWEPLGGRIAAIDRRGTIAVWDSATGELLARSEGRGGSWSGLSWSTRGLIAAGSDRGVVHLYDALTLEAVGMRAGHSGAVLDAAFSPQGERLATTGAGGRLVVWSLGGSVASLQPLAPPGDDRPGAIPDSAWPPGSALTLDSASQAEQLAVIGRGTVEAYDGWDNLVAVAGGTGVWVYDRLNRIPLRYLEGGRSFGVRFSPDGRFLAVRELRLVRIWDIEDAQVLRALPAGLGVQDAQAWSPDGGMLALADRQGIVSIYNMSTGEILLQWETGAEVFDLAWSPDGRRLAASSGTDIWLWDVISGVQVALMRGHEGPVLYIAFHPSRPILLSGGAGDSLRLWDLDSIVPPDEPAEGEEVAWPDVAQDSLTGKNPAETTSLAWSPGGDIFYTQGGCCTVFAWGTATREIQDALDSAGDLRLLRDGSVLQAFTALDAHLGAQNAVAWFNRGEGMPPGLAMLGADGQLRVMDVSGFTWDNLADWLNAEGPVMDLLPGSPAALTVRREADSDQIVQYGPNEPLDWSRGLLPNLSSNPGAFLAAVSADGIQILYSVLGEDGQAIQFTDFDSGAGATLAVLDPEPAVVSLAWSPDGIHAAAGLQDGSVIVWNVETRDRLYRARIFEESLSAIAWSPGGTTLAAAGSDGGSSPPAIRILRSGSGQQVLELAGVFGRSFLEIAYSPDGFLLASGDSAGGVQLWNAATGERLAVLGGHKLRITGIAFTADGSALATSSRDGTVRVWGAP